jgi:ADP-heptose:LPS heptosyltransferase
LPPPDLQPASPRPRLLVLEFWGLGDLTFATPFLRSAQERYDITLVGKEHAAQLLQPSFPEVRFISFDAPWSAYLGKYALWRWNWRELFALFGRLRAGHFDAAVSVRNDPRDHLFMLLAGARTRFGFPFRGSGQFLTHSLARSSGQQHKVEDWRDLGRALDLPGMADTGPRLEHGRYRSAAVDQMFAGGSGKPIVGLHPGARIGVRRWPEDYFAFVIEKLRTQFDFQLVLVPGPEGCSDALLSLADLVLRPLTVPELVDVLGRVDLLLCNDSGPGHIAAACGRPVIPIFGPTHPDWFRPWGGQHHVVIRDICPWRPCFDYCKFSQPYCMTKLLPDRVWPEIREHLESLIERGLLPREFARSEAAAVP